MNHRVHESEKRLDHRDANWLDDLDTISLFGWTKETFDNLRIYTPVM